MIAILNKIINVDNILNKIKLPMLIQFPAKQFSTVYKIYIYKSDLAAKSDVSAPVGCSNSFLVV